MGAIDISSVLSKSYVANAQASEGALAIQANAAGAQSSFIDTRNRLIDIGNADALIETTKGNGQLVMESASQRVALSLGEDPADLMGKQAQRARELATAQEARAAALDKIAEKRKVSFFDNPIEHIINQFTINDDIEAHNAANAKANDIEAQIAENNKFLATEHQNFVLGQTTVTAGSVAASANRVRQLANVQADTATRQAYAASSESVMQLTQLSAQQLQFAATALNAQQTAEQVRMAQAHLALSQEEFDWKKLQKQQGEAANQYLMDTINRGLTAIDPNQPLLTAANPKFLSIIQGKVPLDGVLKQAFELGEMNRKVDPNGGTSRILGVTPVQTLQTLAFDPYLAPDQKAVASRMIEVVTAAKQSAEYKVIAASKDEQAAKAYLNTAVQEAFKLDAAKISGPTNPYWLPSLDSIVKNTPGLQELPTWQKVIAPAIAAKVELSNPDMVMQLIASAASKGEISPNQAALDVSTIYKQGQRVNVESKQFKNMGIAPLLQYNVPIRTGPTSSPTVDASNPNEVLRTLSIIMSRRYNSGPSAFSAEVSASPIIRGATKGFQLFDDAATEYGQSMIPVKKGN